MNASAFSKFDKAAFFKVVEAANDDQRFEFVRGRILQQQKGNTRGHVLVATEFLMSLARQLDETEFDVLGPGFAVETDETVRYPDVLVVPSNLAGDAMATRVTPLIVEVLSPTSVDRDLCVKPAEYLSIPSLQAYIVASQDEPACLVWQRGADGTFPAEPVEIKGQAGVIRVAQLSVEIALADVYRGIC
jgi:Uma2 family endonuclease